MPMGYQPPKFLQFDGMGNPKQHIAHFIETCNNAGMKGDYLVKQEFLNRFYSNCRTISMLELISMKQWKD
ncbi:hypothetical protein ACFX2K_035059 [Malus domestica]